MAKQDTGDDLSKEIWQQNKPLFHCDLLRSTATSTGTYSPDTARKTGDANDFKTERRTLTGEAMTVAKEFADTVRIFAASPVANRKLSNSAGVL